MDNMTDSIKFRLIFEDWLIKIQDLPAKTTDFSVKNTSIFRFRHSLFDLEQRTDINVIISKTNLTNLLSRRMELY